MTDGQSQDSIEEAAQLIHGMNLVRTYAVTAELTPLCLFIALFLEKIIQN